MDIDKGLVAACLNTGRKGLKLIQDAGVRGDMLAPEAGKALDFIRLHVREHGVMPSQDYFTDSTGFVAPQIEDPLSVYIKEAKDRHLWTMQVSLANELGAVLNKGHQHSAAAQEMIETYFRAVRKAGASKSAIRSVWAMGKKVLEEYEDRKAGKMGVPTPWRTMNEMTMGFNAGDLVVFAARLGIGKTWVLLMLAIAAFQEGYHVLFISPEMAPVTLASRVYSLHNKLAYGRLRSGKLGDLGESALAKAIAEMEDQDGFDLLASDFRCSPAAIDDAIAIIKPDIVFIDGLYLVQGVGSSRTEKMANVADEVKIMAGDYAIPIVCSTQFNRNVLKNDPETVDVGSIGLSDAIGWNASIGFALVQTDEMRANKQWMFRPLKIREGGDMRDIWLNADFDRMDFSEESETKAKSFNDQDFDQYSQQASDDANTLLDEKEKADYGIPFADE